MDRGEGNDSGRRYTTEGYHCGGRRRSYEVSRERESDHSGGSREAHQGSISMTLSSHGPHRVVHVIYAGLGGHGAVLFSLLEGGFLAASKNFVLFLGVEAPRSEYIEKCNRLGVPYAHVSKLGVGFCSFTRQIYRKLRGLTPDCVFLHGLAAVPAACLYKLRWRRTAIILRETQAFQLKTWKDWVFLALASFVFDRIVYLTDEARNANVQRLGVFGKLAQTSVIGNGLDLDAFAGVYFPSSAEIKIGMQSRFQSNKDHATLLRAFKMVLARCPQGEFTLHLAGDGETLPAVRRYAMELGISDRVHFPGMLDQTQLVDFLQSLTLYVHSTYGETMSTAIMQAMATGLPVIASDVSGVSNMVNGESGLVFPLENEEALADLMVGLVRCPERLIALSLAARTYAENEFDASVVQRKYEECIDQVMREVSLQGHGA